MHDKFIKHDYFYAKIMLRRFLRDFIECCKRRHKLFVEKKEKSIECYFIKRHSIRIGKICSRKSLKVTAIYVGKLGESIA